MFLDFTWKRHSTRAEREENTRRDLFDFSFLLSFSFDFSSLFVSAYATTAMAHFESDHWKTEVGVGAAGCFLSIVSVAARMYTRYFVTRSVGVDDLMAIVSLVGFMEGEEKRGRKSRHFDFH